MALSLVGQVCHEMFQRENKRKTVRKLFIREHQLKVQLSVLCIPLLTPPLPPPSFSSIYFIALFSHSVSFALSIPLLLTILFLLPLSAAVTDFFLPRLKYEYFRAKKLKGNNEMAPKLNYTRFPESQKRDFSEWWAHRCHVGVSFSLSHTHISLLSPAFMLYLCYSPGSCFYNC